MLGLSAACRTAETRAVAKSTSPSASTSIAAVDAGEEHDGVAATSATPASDLVQQRPYRLIEPDSGDAGPRPLVVMLHGYGSSGANHDTYFGLSPLTKRRGVLLAIPNGTRDHKGLLYWNATEACCDFDGAPVDDVAYLDAIVSDVMRRARVDPARIYVIGHSNGAFMAHAWACEHGSPVAAIVALAGVPWVDAARCENHNVSVLQVHGDADRVIEYGGGRSFGSGAPYPSAETTVSSWAKRDRCVGSLRVSGTSIDLDRAVAGAETERDKYDCPAGLDVELWRMRGSGHVPRFDAHFATAALDFLLAHRKQGIH